MDLDVAFSLRRTMKVEELGEIRSGLGMRQLVLLCSLGRWHPSKCLLGLRSLPMLNFGELVPSRASRAQTTSNPNMTFESPSLVLLFRLSSTTTQRGVF